MSIADDDLFQDPAEEPTRPSRRSGGGSGRGRGGAQGGNGGNPLQQPRVRGLIALGLLVVVALILISTIRGCQRDKLVDSYKSYLGASNAIATESEAMGRQLQKLLDNDALLRRAAIVAEVTKLSTQATDHATRAKDLDAPDQLSAAHRTFVTSLEYRALGLSQLPEAIDTAIRADDGKVAAATLADPLQILAASDVIYRTSYKLPAENAITKDKIKEVRVEESELFPGTTYNKTSPEGASKVITSIKRFRRSTNPVTGGADPASAVHGLSISGVFAVREGKKTQLVPGTSVSLNPNGTTFEVVVENGGDFVEAGIDVTFTYTSPNNEAGVKSTKTIDEISPGQTNKQTLPFELGAQPYIGESTITVDVAPVPEEKKTDNNKATYPIEFTIT